MNLNLDFILQCASWNFSQEMQKLPINKVHVHLATIRQGALRSNETQQIPYLEKRG